MNDNVYVLNNMDMHSIHKNAGSCDLVLKKIRSTSVFMGFCKGHDKSLFSKIEDEDFLANQEQCFLFAYRSYAKEIYNKEVNFFNSKETYGLAMSYASDKQKKAETFGFLSSYFEGLLMAIKDMRSYKPKLDKMIAQGDFTEVRAYILEFNSVQPVMASGSFLVEKDMNGLILQDLSLQESGLGNIHLNAFASGGKGYVVFTWLEDGHQPCERFIRSLESIQDDRIEAAVIRIIFNHLENFAISPVWWSGLSEAVRAVLVQRMQPVTLLSLIEDGLALDSWNILTRKKVGY